MINPKDLDLNTLPWLPLTEKVSFPEQPAIYFAIDANDVIQYIGRSKNPRQRWRQHHRYKELNAIAGIKIAYLFIDRLELFSEIEKALIAWFNPCLNEVVPSELEPRLIKGSDRNRDVKKVCIAELREAKNLTQSELADAINADVSTVRNFERGRSGINMIKRLIKICDALDCNIRDLVDSSLPSPK